MLFSLVLGFQPGERRQSSKRVRFNVSVFDMCYRVFIHLMVANLVCMCALCFGPPATSTKWSSSRRHILVSLT
jgi:hypothetical protein